MKRTAARYRRHRSAILDLLDEYGPLDRHELRYELRRRSRRSRTLNRQLFTLALAGRIVCYPDPEEPGLLLYRLATATDQAEARRIDTWLRKVLGHDGAASAETEGPF